MKNITLKKASASLVILGMLSLGSVNTTLASSLKMSVFEGYTSSEMLLAGDYSQAIEVAKTGLDSKSTYKRTVESTTLCVGYTKLGKFDSAKPYCELAMENSKKASTLRKAAISYTDDVSDPMSIVKVAEINHKAMASLIDYSANVISNK